MNILFITFYDPDHLGTKLLSSYMKLLGHNVHYLQFKTFPIFDKKYNLPENQIIHKDGKIKKVENIYQKGWHPITEREIELFKSVIYNFSPKILAFSYRSITEKIVKKMLLHAKDAAPDALCIAGGFGPTFEPETALQELGFDIIVRGEGEEPLHELLDAIENNTSWKSIKNLCYIENSKIHSNPLRELIRNLDAYPFPVTDEYISNIENNKLTKGDYRTPQEWPLRGCGYPIMASRGCPLRCSYCSSVSGLKNLYKSNNITNIPYRRRNLDHVLEELRYAKKNGEKSITFVDEFFIYPYQELLSFFKIYKRDIDLFFFAYFNTEQFLHHPELIDAAIDAGLVAAFFGVQHGSETFCRKIYNRINNNDNFIRLAKEFFRRGIMSEWSYIGGNLLETENEFNETLAFAKRMPFDPGLAITTDVSISNLRIFKNTPLEAIYPSGVYDPKKIYYNSQLIRLRSITDDATFTMYKEEKFKNNPDLLTSEIEKVKQSLHKTYLLKESARLEGQEVYFFGFGESYKKNKNYFKKTRPVCFIHDLADCTVQEIDDIPVYHISKIESNNKILPIVIFSYGAYIIHRKLMRDYPKFKDKIFVQLK